MLIGFARRPPLFLLLLILTAALSSSCARWLSPQQAQVAEYLRAEVSSKSAPEYVSPPNSPESWRAVQAFYERRDYRPAWGNGAKLTARELVESLCRADEEGLDPDRYGLPSIARLHRAAHDRIWRSRSTAARELARLDVALTSSLLAYSSHLINGYTRPQWDVGRETLHLEAIERVSSAGGLGNFLKTLLPLHPQYEKVKRALAQYRQIAKAGDWPKVADAADTANLVERLARSGDLEKNNGSNPNAIWAAVKRFQKRHGLVENGKLDAATLSALNVPLDLRIRQIEINLERWRWIPRDLGRRHILVNIPAFELQSVDNGRTVLKMPVVVGKEYKPTPVFSDSMTHIVLNPSWNIPAEIAKNEMLPIITRDPVYLVRNDIEVIPAGSTRAVDPQLIDWNSLDRANFPYQLRQKPGENNSLGRIKFVFPNRFDVYLHDTPADHLFNRKKRDFSHGCIRVARPFELAAWVLEEDPAWTVDSLQNAAQTNEERTIRLREPLPVHILYWTTWVEDDGTVSFREDLYEHDKKMLAIISRQTSVSEPTRAACQYLLGTTQ